MTLFNPVFNCLTPIVIKRSKTQADEGLTTADEAGYVVLRQPQDSIETQLVNLGRGTAQKLSCGVYPNKFVVRPLHALSPVVGAHLRLECDPVLRSATIRNGVPRIPPSSAQPHARPRDRESSAGSEKHIRDSGTS